MSQWGNLDNVTLKGTVTTSSTSDLVNGYGGTEFNSNIKAGDYVTIASNKYQVQNVVSNTQFYLTNICATTSANVGGFIQQGPKDIANVSFPANNYSIQNIYGFDRVEVTIPENKARGVQHTGWVHYTTYIDANGGTRHKAETLVAMSKNFASNAAGYLFGTDAGQDADDDAVFADYLTYFTAQPSDVRDYYANLSAATFSVTATTDPAGGTLSYQWQRAANVVDAAAGYWTNVANAGVYSNNTSATLNISNTSGLNGNVFRANVTAGGGADSNVSLWGNILITV